MTTLGIDIGGTGCKCAAFSECGEQLALSYAEYPLGSGQVDLPSEILLSSVFQVISGCAAELKAPDDIQALTVSSFGESFVPVDADGKALTGVRLYYGNAGCADFSQLTEKIGEEKFMEIARIRPDVSYSLSGMLSVREAAERPVWKYLFIAGYICYQLTGKACTDESLACRSLLYDVRRRCWSEELMQLSGICSDTLPDVLPTGSIVGKIIPYIARKLNLPEDVNVVIGGHDQIVNALGAGVCRPGDAADTTGTCECITPLFSRIPEGLEFQKNNFACVPYPGGSGYVTYAYNVSAGSVIRWCRELMNKYLFPEAEAAGKSIYDLFTESCPLSSTDLMVLPFLQGMGGTPDVNASARGLIAGLTTATRLPDLYRAILEGITFEMRYNQEKLSENDIAFERLFACGGGARSSVWLQLKADILGCSILPVKADETGAMGSAILGFAALTGESPFAVAGRFIQYGESIFPNKENQEIYHKRFEVYKALRGLYLSNSILR